MGFWIRSETAAGTTNVRGRKAFVPAGRTAAMDPTEPETACFEAGVKFGSLYHQFAGTPVSPSSTASLERAMAEAIENQPHCTSVTVEIHDDRVAAAIDHEEGYTELTGELMTVEMRIDYEDTTVWTSMEMADGYPRMAVEDVES
jgi:hypothetical protein